MIESPFSTDFLQFDSRAGDNGTQLITSPAGTIFEVTQRVHLPVPVTFYGVETQVLTVQ